MLNNWQYAFPQDVIDFRHETPENKRRVYRWIMDDNADYWTARFFVERRNKPADKLRFIKCGLD